MEKEYKKAPQILVVDDDRDYAETLADVLDLSGYAVETVHTGEDAVKRCGERTFDGVLMDVKLPGMSGVQSFLEIRGMNTGTRVMLMTGHSVQDVVEGAVAKGAWGVLQKPFDMPFMLEKLTRMLRG